MDGSAGDLALFMTLRRELVNYASGIIGDRVQAEDLVQDAFLRLMPGEGGATRSIEQPAAYAYRVVRNLALDSIRRRAREQAHHQSPPQWLVPMEIEDPADTCQHGMALERLAEALEAMPTASRRALEMHRFGGYTLAQIAEQLDISVTSAHRLLHEALLRLAKVMGQPATRSASGR